MEQTLPTTRAEEIAAKEYPDLFIRDDKMKTSGTALISDAAQMLRHEGFINGYKQGQHDRWISVNERLPEEYKCFVLAYSPDRDIWIRVWCKDWMGEWNGCHITHWMRLPSPPNPEQR